MDGRCNLREKWGSNEDFYQVQRVICILLKI